MSKIWEIFSKAFAKITFVVPTLLAWGTTLMMVMVSFRSIVLLALKLRTGMCLVVDA